MLSRCGSVSIVESVCHTQHPVALDRTKKTENSMADTWVTDMTHFLDPGGRVPELLLSRGPVKHFGAIVAAVTSEPVGVPDDLAVKCRRRPRRKPCPGRICVSFEAGTSNIAWECPACGDRGLIHHWQGTPWDKGGRAELPDIRRVTYLGGFMTDTQGDSRFESTVLEGRALSREVVVSIHDNELLGAAGEYGDPLVGDPIQCDELLIEHANGTTEIVLYNRAIMLFRSNDEIYKQIHRVCCTIERTTGPAQQDPVL